MAIRESALLGCKNVLFDVGVFKEREGIKVPYGNYNEAYNVVCKLLSESI
jgi:hypothetical protein